MLTGQKCKVADIVHKAFWCEYLASGEQLYMPTDKHKRSTAPLCAE